MYFEMLEEASNASDLEVVETRQAYTGLYRVSLYFLAGSGDVPWMEDFG